MACVNTGRGKTVAIHTALAQTPHANATWVRAPLYPTVAEFRRALFEALAVPGRFPHRSSSIDAALITALAAAPVRRLVVVDKTQRLPRPCLEFLHLEVTATERAAATSPVGLHVRNVGRSQVGDAGRGGLAVRVERVDQGGGVGCSAPAVLKGLVG
ncbi:ATP-binding protein [Embleya sp. NPDC005575]|uniref:ATP-binding protein n=1 Tax=Embleya sp. NPDC005575 TaxID=3156892 RepID=UPI0033A491C6